MKQLLMILFITNLYVACGKQDKSGSPSMIAPQEEQSPQTSQNPTPPKKEAKEEDFDGDQIPNSEDTRPYISDRDSIASILDFSINNVSKTLQHILNDNIPLSAQFRKKPIGSVYHLDEKSGKYFLKIDKGQAKNELIIKNNSSTDSIYIDIYNSHNQIHSNLEIEANTSKIFNIPQNLVPNKKIFFTLSKRNVDTKQSPKTFELTIKEGNKTTTSHISTKLNLNDALVELGLEYLIADFKYSQNLLMSGSFTKQENDQIFWKLINTSNQKMDYQPKAGEVIYLTAFTKKELSKALHRPVQHIRFSRDGERIAVNVRDILSFKLKLEVKYQVHSQDILKARFNPPYAPNSQITLGCNYLNYPEPKLRAPYRLFLSPNRSRSPDSIFNFYVDNQRVNYSELKLFQLKISTDLKLIIELKDKINRQYKVGAYDGDQFCPGHREYKEKQKKNRTTSRRNILDLVINLEYQQI